MIGTIGLLLVLGWLAATALNYLSDVLPTNRKFTAITCPNCQHKTKWLDYLLLRKCTDCGQKRSPRAWIVQITTPVVAVIVWFFPPQILGAYLAFVVFFYLDLVFIMDAEHRIILHPVSIAGAILAIPLGIWLNGWLKTLIGGIAGFGFMLALYYFGALFSRLVSRARNQPIDEIALGFGDVNLSGVLGLMLGWPRIWVNLLFAIVLGGLVSGGYILFMLLRKRYQAFTAIPYAPFLIIAAVVLFYLA
jgi:leader peptidase (prepilin peptidase)/N-methyltransferase